MTGGLFTHSKCGMVSVNTNMRSDRTKQKIKPRLTMLLLENRIHHVSLSPLLSQDGSSTSATRSTPAPLTMGSYWGRLGWAGKRLHLTYDGHTSVRPAAAQWDLLLLRSSSPCPWSCRRFFIHSLSVMDIFIHYPRGSCCIFSQVQSWDNTGGAGTPSRGAGNSTLT